MSWKPTVSSTDVSRELARSSVLRLTPTARASSYRGTSRWSRTVRHGALPYYAIIGLMDPRVASRAHEDAAAFIAFLRYKE